MSGKLIRIDIDGTKTEETYISSRPYLEQLQRLVGGYIQLVDVTYEGVRREAYLDEDGIGKVLSPNKTANELVNKAYLRFNGMIYGPLVIMIPEK